MVLYTMQSIKWIRKITIFQFDFVFTLVSTNINQSASAMVKNIYITICSLMGLIMGVIAPAGPDLSTFELEKLLNMTVYTIEIASINMNQSAPNLVKMYMSIGSQIESLIGPEWQELFAFLWEKLHCLTVYTLASTNINHSARNFIKMSMTIQSKMNFINGLNHTRMTGVICPWIRGLLY